MEKVSEPWAPLYPLMVLKVTDMIFQLLQIEAEEKVANGDSG